MEARFKDIRKFMGRRGARFKVPRYQRGYEWGKQQWEDLWLDINRIGDGVDQHFLGNIILLERDVGEVYEIVDGQQRMTSLSLIVMAIRDAPYQEDRDDMRIDDIINYYPRNKSERRLVLNDNKADETYQMIWEGKGQQASGRVADAYSYYRSKVNKLEANELSALLDKIVKSVVIVETIARDSKLAYTVFQSQNDRGKEVEPQTLIKARIHGAADDYDSREKQQKVIGMWNKIYRQLDDEISMPRFQTNLQIRRPITQILTSSEYSTPIEISKANLYRDFERILKQFNDVEAFVEWFDKKVNKYMDITSNRYDVTGRDIPNGADRHIQYLNAASTHAETLSLSILNNVDKDELIEEYLRLSSILAMRVELADLSSNRPNHIFRAAGKVRDAEDPIDIRSELIEAINSSTPSNSEIIESINANGLSVRGAWQFRALLKLVSIEEERRGPVQLNLDRLEIEHIAPRKTFDKPEYSRWRRHLNREEFENQKDLIGNLVLLDPSDHSGINEQNFDKKRSTYTNSDIHITEAVADYQEWSSNTINERTERLAKELVSRWSV